MVLPLRYSVQARTSLADIAEYVFHQSGPIAAEAFASAIEEKCRSLAAMPGQMGRERPELQPTLRSYAFKNHVIFFRYTADAFEVVDIVHGRRDFDDYFSGQ